MDWHERPWYIKILHIIFWAIVVVVGLFIVAINWPLSKETQWALAVGCIWLYINWMIQDATRAAVWRHEKLSKQISALEYRIQNLESAVAQVPRRTLELANEDPLAY